jgi:hypothetical protein
VNCEAATVGCKAAFVKKMLEIRINYFYNRRSRNNSIQFFFTIKLLEQISAVKKQWEKNCFGQDEAWSPIDKAKFIFRPPLIFYSHQKICFLALKSALRRRYHHAFSEKGKRS